MRRLPPILLVLLCMLSPLAAWAMPVLRASADRVSAGDELVIEWSQLPAGTHEVELELSLDGGRWLRISPELEAREGRFVWTVPAGLSGAARVRLRYGRDHEEHEGGSFALSITTASHVASPAPSRDADEWWNVGEQSAAPRSHGLNDAPSLTPSVAQYSALPTDPTPAVAPPAPAPRSTRELTESRTALPRARAFAPPRSTPLRN
ncbi:MAG: hypothetical protein K8R56_04955 [Candidatus Eisenbacteria bacterium]|nr:hypothetical protein [Candidatus Eisenbacteria bacterium]